MGFPFLQQRQIYIDLGRVFFAAPLFGGSGWTLDVGGLVLALVTTRSSWRERFPLGHQETARRMGLWGGWGWRSPKVVPCPGVTARRPATQAPAD
eukprot:gene7418-biopygen1506